MKNKIKKIIIFITPPFFLYFYGKLKKIFFPQKKSEIFYEKNFYNRRAFIFKAIKKYDNCKYLEIGVNTCETFNSIPLKIEDKFGVDPIAGNYQMTSDEFFKKYPNLKFDVIFIDGLHHYEQCQRDCINSIKQLNKDGIILMHDLLPLHEKSQQIPQNYSPWNGDVWKVAVELFRSKNSDFKIINIDTGIGILKHSDKFEYKKMPELEKCGFDDYLKYYREFNIISSEEALNFIQEA